MVDTVENKIKKLEKFSLTASNISDINENIQLFPNPGHDFVVIENNDQQPIISIDIMDMSGQILEKLSPEKNQSSYRVNISSLSKGAYLIRLIFENKQITGKIIKN